MTIQFLSNTKDVGTSGMVKTVKQLRPQRWEIPLINIEASELIDVLGMVSEMELSFIKDRQRISA